LEGTRRVAPNFVSTTKIKTPLIVQNNTKNSNTLICQHEYKYVHGRICGWAWASCLWAMSPWVKKERILNYWYYYNSKINDSVTFNIKTTTNDTEKTTATINSTIILNNEKGQLCLGFFCLHQGQTMNHRHF
jgi:hypothetical protein